MSPATGGSRSAGARDYAAAQPWQALRHEYRDRGGEGTLDRGSGCRRLVRARPPVHLDTMRRATAGGLVADNQFLYDDGAAQVVRTAFPEQVGDRCLDRAAFIAGSDPYSDFDFGMLKPVIRSDFIRATGLAYHENAKLSEDFLYMLEFLAKGGRGWLAARPTYYWCQAFGTISRRWTETGAGHWRYNFLSAAAANAEVLGAMQRAGENELASLLQRRIRAFERLHWMQELNRMRADGAGPARLAGTVLGHPSIWPLVAQRGMRRAARAMTLRSLERV